MVDPPRVPAEGVAALFAGHRLKLLRLAVLLVGDEATAEVTPGERSPLGMVISPVISADGTKMYMVAAQPSPTGGPKWTRLIEVDVATGRQLRVLFEQRYGGNPDNSVWMFTSVVRDPSGRNLLVLSNGYGYRIDLATARATRIPFPDGEPNSLTW